MKITGTIDSIDYINIGKLLKKPKIPTWQIVLLISVQFVVSIKFGRYFAEETGGFIVFCLFLFLLLTLSIGIVLLSKLAWKKFLITAEFYNMGNCSYQAEDLGIYFKGTTFNCYIPYESIHKVQMSDGTGCIIFTDNSGFIIPKNNSGNINEFIQFLNTKIII